MMTSLTGTVYRLVKTRLRRVESRHIHIFPPDTEFHRHFVKTRLRRVERTYIELQLITRHTELKPD